METTSVDRVLTFISAKQPYPEIQFKSEAQDNEKCKAYRKANGIAYDGSKKEQKQD